MAKNVIEIESALSQHLDWLYNTALRMMGNSDDAKDAVQEACVKAFRKWESYDKSRSLKNWLTAILVNTCRDAFRARRRLTPMDKADPEALSDRGSLKSRLEERLLGEELLERLPFDFRSVMVLFYIDGWSIREIAGILKIPSILVKVRLFRARKKLLESMK